MVNNDNPFRCGAKLRLVRERKGITLKEVARQIGVSESLISQIERNRVSPSLDTLLAICDVLNIDPEYLFRDYRKPRKVHISDGDSGRKLETENVVYRELAVFDTEECRIEALELIMAPAAEKGDPEYGHKGTEIGYIMEGSAELYYGNKSYTITEGQTISFSGEVPHLLKNTGKKPLKALWILTPPRVFHN